MPSPRASGNRLDQVMHQFREPIFWLNGDLKLIWVNPAWEELTGRPAESALGTICNGQVPSRSGPGNAPDLDLGGSLHPPGEALAGRGVSSHALIVHPSGERRWRRVEYWPFHNEKGELTALLGLIRNLEEAPHFPDSESRRLRVELLQVRERAFERLGIDGLIGKGAAHRRLLEQVKAAAGSSAPVLIVGEAGTGKRLVARTIHQLGPRNAPILPLDCAALPPDVLVRELFGMERDLPAPPRLILSEGSTLLIGDVLDLPRDLQDRLAQALDAPIRLIGMTSGDPDEALEAERLRPDLYYLLTALVVRLAPLRERVDEIELLAQFFLERANHRGSRQRAGFSAEARKVLLAYDWPGNLRELARVVDDAHGKGRGDTIEAEDLPAAIRGSLASSYLPPPSPPVAIPLDELLTQVERRIIENALVRARHNKSRAADQLGISRPRLYRRIKELDIPDEVENGDETALAAHAPPEPASQDGPANVPAAASGTLPG